MTAWPAILILAGGEGRRMGGDKPLRLLGGKTLIARALEFARARSDLVRLSVRDPVQAGELAYVQDDPWIEGPLAGLAAGLRFARDCGRDHLLTMPCDMPFLPEDLLPRLERAIGGRETAVASSGGFLHPVCALWRSSAADALGSYLNSGQRSLKGFAEAAGFAAAEWPAEPDPFFNINSQADLDEAERRIAG